MANKDAKAKAAEFGVRLFQWVPLIISAMTSVERRSGETGKGKQDLAVKIMGGLMPLVEGAVGRDLVDEAKVETAVRTVMDAIVALEKVVKDVESKKGGGA